MSWLLRTSPGYLRESPQDKPRGCRSHSTRSRCIDRCFLTFDLPLRMGDTQKRTREKEFIVVHNSYENQPIDRTFGDSHDRTDLFPQASTIQDDAIMPEKPVHANRRRFISLL